MKCTFFGHRDAPGEIRDKIKEAMINLIEQENVTEFYVGDKGSFDRMSLSVLKELAAAYPQIKYCVVYAYIPNEGREDFEHTVFPEGIESAPKRFAIDYRNRWMEKHSDFVIAYVGHSLGGAAKYVETARKHGKKVIDLCE